MSKTIYQKPGNKNNGHFYLKILTVFFLMLSFACCGKKGPPIPPEMFPLPTVSDLEAKQVNNSIELIWSVQTGKNVPAPEGFRIYRSKKSLVDSDECPGCPDVFEKVSELATPFSLWGRAENRFNYREALEIGYVYRYKVMAFTDSGLTSDWSNTVEMVVKSKSPNSEN
jgi:predicted small lipoprotein YifL